MISIIIPTYNEAGNILKLIQYLLNALNKNEKPEIIVSDGGSADATISIAQKAGAKAVVSPKKGRAAQMNFGASLALGDILYFIHADTFPPLSFIGDINKAIVEGYALGRYRTKFDSNKPLLKVNAFFTRYDLFMCYGGDQTLFITSKLFNQLQGFKEDMMIMEDYDLVNRARQFGKYKIFSNTALVSARKYDTNNWFKVQWANKTIFSMYQKGASQQEMVNKYKALLDYR